MQLFRFEKFSKDEKFRLDSIKERKIFLSASKNFNDLKDCELEKIFFHDYDQEIFEKIKKAIDFMPNSNAHPLYDKFIRFFETLDPSSDDPFLCLSSSDWFNSIKYYFLDNIGICCFSEEISDLMWAYYGDVHRGYCVEYEVDLEKIRNIKKVHYSTGRDNISIHELLFAPANTILRVIGTKNIYWQHEKEWRVYDYSGINVNKLIPLPEGMTQVRIITGENFCKENETELMSLGLNVIGFYQYIKKYKS